MKKLLIIFALFLGLSACATEEVQFVSPANDAYRLMSATEMEAYLDGVNYEEINAMNSGDYLLSQYENVAFEVVELTDGEVSISNLKVLNDSEGNRRMFYQGVAGSVVNDSVIKGIGYMDIDGEQTLMVFPYETYTDDLFGYFYYEVGDSASASIINGELVIDSVRQEGSFKEVSRAYLNMGSLRLEREIVNTYYEDEFIYSATKTVHYDTETYILSKGYDYIVDPEAEQVTLTLIDELSDGTTYERQVEVRKGTELYFPYYLYDLAAYYDEAATQEVEVYAELLEDTTIYLK